MRVGWGWGLVCSNPHGAHHLTGQQQRQEEAKPELTDFLKLHRSQDLNPGLLRTEFCTNDHDPLG